jgi:glycosyltransferase involved in cell wall biosynthesis
MSRDAGMGDDGGMGGDGGVPLVGFVLAETSGGIGRHVRDVARRLGDLGQPPYVAAPSSVLERFGFGEVAAAVAVDGSRARREGLRRLFGACDVVHAHGLRAGAAAAASAGRGGAPLVQTWHNTPPTDRVRARIAEHLARRSARAARITLGVSDDLVAWAQRSGARTARWTPVAAPALPPPARSPADVRAELDATLGERLGAGGTAAARPLVLAVGRLAPQKGFDVLADAADLLATGWTGGSAAPLVVIAGEGPERGRLTGRAVRLLGQRDDVAELIAASDVVAMPSRWEGWPLVAQEVLRGGRALLATPVGGLPRLAGDAARWVPVGDAGALADAITALVSDAEARAELEARSLMRAEGLPDEGDMMAALLAVYREVMGQP